MRLPSICSKATYLFVKNRRMYSISIDIRPSKNDNCHFSLAYILPFCFREIQHTTLLIELTTYHLNPLF